MKINENYKNLEESYLFSTIAKKVDEYTKTHPEAKVIKMGIGDVTLPICQKQLTHLQKQLWSRARRLRSMDMVRSRDMIFCA